MNNKNLNTLQIIFDVPVRVDVRWEEVRILLVALNADISQGRGSRVRVYLNGERGVFHQPHPTSQPMCRGLVKDVKDLLTEAGVTPKKIIDNEFDL